MLALKSVNAHLNRLSAIRSARRSSGRSDILLIEDYLPRVSRSVR